MQQNQFRNKTTILKKGSRKNSSHRWLTRQLNDPYVAMAKSDGYRSRAAYKILEMHDKFNLFREGLKVVDLGAAPGGWSQVAAKYVGSSGAVVAIDLLEIAQIAHVLTIKMDFFDTSAPDAIKTLLQSRADIVMSDMAANATGHSKTDHLRIMDLCERSLDFAIDILTPGGNFIAKILRGGAEEHLLTKAKQNFEKVSHFKPLSSRSDSKEMYLIGMRFKGK